MVTSIFVYSCDDVTCQQICALILHCSLLLLDEYTYVGMDTRLVEEKGKGNTPTQAQS